jgi:hypothetical protein
MFAAMRLPAARRFAATILRATITGSDNFISILVFEAIAAKRFYRIAASRILRPVNNHGQTELSANLIGRRQNRNPAGDAGA